MKKYLYKTKLKGNSSELEDDCTGLCDDLDKCEISKDEDEFYLLKHRETLEETRETINEIEEEFSAEI